MKRKYIKLSEPIEIKSFEEAKKPIGWLRLDRILEDKKDLLTEEEIKQILRNDILREMKGGLKGNEHNKGN